MAQDLITIGKILKARGIHGELKVLPLTDFLERFNELKDIILTSPDGNDVEYKVNSVRYHKGCVLLRFEGCSTIDEAKRFINWSVRIPKEPARELPSGRYYWSDLIGMTVHSDAGLLVGEIIDVFSTGSNDVFVIKGRKKELLIPATIEVVKDVDVKNKRMTIHIIKGLIGDDEM
ncbi:MAG: 16S rRNA processing protein RimM [Nitrospirae bacterium]|nr:16S rRNA processing protein RimM [Nitrospirota bacterium]